MIDVVMLMNNYQIVCHIRLAMRKFYC